MKRIMLTLVLAIAAGVWSLNWASGSQITSLCDEWNVLVYKEGDSTSCGNSFSTCHYYLKDDTLINSTHYTKAFYEKEYIGALRESEDASKIFGIPANYTHEYLIYDWSAQPGDTLQNYWVGYHFLDRLNVTEVIVRGYGTTKPRLISIQVGGYNKFNSDDTTHYVGSYKIIEGVGVKPVDPLVGGPIMHRDMADGEHTLLCAYKNGEQVYQSQESKYYGCYFDNRLVTEALSGQWKLYKETIRPFNASEETIVTRDVDNDSLYIFTNSTMLVTCPTCDSTPSVYGIVWYNGGETGILVRGLFGSKTSDTIKAPYSTLSIEKMTRNEIEWSFREIYTENKYCYHYQYLKRYPEELSDTIPLFIKDGPGSSTVEPVDPNLIYATLSKDILSIYAMKEMEINMVLYKAPSANHAPAVKRAIKATTFTDSISTTLTESGTYTLELTHPAWDYTIVGTFDYQLPQAVENTPANTPSATKILKDGRLFLRYKGQMYNVQGQQVQ